MVLESRADPWLRANLAHCLSPAPQPEYVSLRLTLPAALALAMGATE
jgi:hypothetical protein